MSQPEQFSSIRNQLGEGCLWHPEEQALYWVDINIGRLLRQTPDGPTEIVHDNPDDPIGGYTFQADGSFLLFRGKGRVERLTDGEITDVLIEELPDVAEDQRFNDVIADPQGRVFCGTMQTAEVKGKLYRLDTDGSIRPVVENVGVSNGLGFSPDLTLMYYVDSSTKTVWVFDYDQASGEITNRRALVDLTDQSYVPDGMTVDAKGHLYIALWGGGAVMVTDADGALVEMIEVPQTTLVPCVCFGGAAMQDLYMNSATYDWQGKPAPETAGYVYRLADAGKGKPEFYSKIKL